MFGLNLVSCVYLHIRITLIIISANKYTQTMQKSNETKPVRELMPEGFLGLIAMATGAWPSNISEVVNSERTTSGIWPEVEKLAIKTDSKSYYERIEYLNSIRRKKYYPAAA